MLALVRSRWPDVLGALREDSRVAWMGFEAGVPLSVSQGTLAVAVADNGRIAFLTRAGHDQRLRQAVLGVLGLDLAVDVVLDPGAPKVPEASEPPPQQAPRTAQARRDPSSPTARAADPRGAAFAAVGGAAGPPANEAVGDAPRRVDRPAQWDDASVDDPDLGGGQGVELIMRELGARKISESDGG